MNWRNALNFSGGPGALPESVLARVGAAIDEVPEVGLSILGISHRSDWFAGVVAELEGNVRQLLGLPPDFHVLFLQGGATQQFTMVPMSLLPPGGFAEYVHSGYWSGKSIDEARHSGDIRVVWSGSGDGFSRLPHAGELRCSPEAAYFHYVSNETVEGVQFHDVLGRDDVLRVCDMSSDFMSQPVDAGRFALIYAHAQKNIGPAGVTIVLVRDKLLEQAPAGLPGFLDYRVQAAAHSIFNTPPVFAIYVCLLVTRWLRDEIGGLENMAAINRRKAAALYQVIDESAGFFRGKAVPAARSLMNVSFSLPSPELDGVFLAEAAAAGFSGLAGHRSLGGVRASIYNAVSEQAVSRLCEFMRNFRRRY